MNLAEIAKERLQISDPRAVSINYSGHIKNYNANARYTKATILFTLSKNLMHVDEDIQIGLIQSLMIKIFKIKNVKTPEMQLYESFIKNLSKYAKKEHSDPLLEAAFHRINEKFFNGLMDKPNLVFAQENFTKLGSYEYGSDTVYLSSIFQEVNEDEMQFLEYVLYHELLHKKHSFQTKNGRHQAHTTAFRAEEAKFGIDMESKLSSFLRKKKYSFKRLARIPKNTQPTLKSMFRFW